MNLKKFGKLIFKSKDPLHLSK